MEKINKQFGDVQVQKVSVISQSTDLYFARLKNRRLNEEVLMVLAPHNENAPNIMLVNQIPWSSIHVRSYANSKILYEALEGKVPVDAIINAPRVELPNIQWKGSSDIELKVESVHKDKNIYVSNELGSNTKVVLFSAYKDNEQGNELESELEFIPAMNTRNFAIIKN